MQLQGKTAIVTGGGRGIGYGCATELARAGADIILNDHPNSADVDAAAKDIEQLGRQCHVIKANVHDRQGCESLIEQALHCFPQLDILICNPAVNIRERFLDLNPDDFETVIHATLISGFHLSQLHAQHLVAREVGGRIVFISSVHALMPYARSVAYNAAKAGLNHMAKTMAVELTECRINVNVIEPGWINTPGEWAAFGKARVEEEGKQLPWGRIGEPADIGKAATFLCSPDADYITGAVLRVDGGFVLKDCRGDSILKDDELH